MLALCRLYPGYLFPMMGLHPTDLTPDYPQVLEQMEERLRQADHPYVAVGEVGLDYYWDKSYCIEQQDAFRRQVEWAIAYQLPLMIHCRAAHRELVDLLNDYRGRGLTGVFHCFGGGLEEARELLSFEGFVLGIGGVVTYKKSPLPEVLPHVPLERIVLETDAPYLAPVPHRGQRNESAYVANTLRIVAKIYKIEPEEMEKCSNDTVKRIFTRMKWA
jgi:TatD DNase family protein